MPIIKSAKKRVKVAKKATIRNAKTKKSLKTAFKAFKKSGTAKSHKELQSSIDKAAKKNVIHKNKASRLKKRAAAQAKASAKATKPAKSAAKKTTKK